VTDVRVFIDDLLELISCVELVFTVDVGLNDRFFVTILHQVDLIRVFMSRAVSCRPEYRLVIPDPHLVQWLWPLGYLILLGRREHLLL